MTRERQELTSSRKSVKASTSTSDGNHIKVLSTSVIGAVDHSTGRETKGHSELVSSSTTTSYSVMIPPSKPTTLRSHSWIRDLYKPHETMETNGQHISRITAGGSFSGNRIICLNAALFYFNSSLYRLNVLNTDG